MKNIRFSTIILFGSILIFSSCKQKRFIHNEGLAFNTVYHITYLSSKDLRPEIDKELQKFDAALSMFNPKSTLSRINKAGTDSFDLQNEQWTRNVIKRSIEISELSHGAFDITVAPLVNAWGFGFKKAGDVSQGKLTV